MQRTRFTVQRQEIVDIPEDENTVDSIMLKGLIKKWTEPAHKLQIFPASAASDENFGISSNRYATFTARQRFGELLKYLKKTVAL